MEFCKYTLGDLVCAVRHATGHLVRRNVYRLGEQSNIAHTVLAARLSAGKLKLGGPIKCLRILTGHSLLVIDWIWVVKEDIELRKVLRLSIASPNASLHFEEFDVLRSVYHFML